MKELKAQITNIAKDLLNLEVNTIIKATINGGKMPSPRHALIEIAREYSSKLTGLGFPLEDIGIKPGSFRSFDAIRERADDGIKSYRVQAATRTLDPQEEANLLMFHRIKDMSDQIKGIFNALKTRKPDEWDNDYTHEEIEEQRPALQLTADELVLIRKVWEVGTEEIVLQTIIQLDGDVVTRVKPRYATGKTEAVHEVHNQGVGVSLEFWRDLIGVVKDFFQTIVKMFM